MKKKHSYLEIDKDELYDLYVNKGFTQNECAEKLGVNVWNVKLAIKKI